jgi:transcription elongation GreA/GreB family factor
MKCSHKRVAGSKVNGKKRIRHIAILDQIGHPKEVIVPLEFRVDKRKLIEHIRSEVEKDVETLTASAKATIEAATGEESKAENQYDTRGLEASYLARGQAKRISDIKEFLVVLKHVVLKDFGPDDKIAGSALIEVESNGKTSHLLMMTHGGGVTVTFEGKKIQIVTPSSPLGEALLDLVEGDVAVVEQGDSVREYEIISVK